MRVFVMNDAATLFILNELNTRLMRWQEEVGYEDDFFDTLEELKYGSRNIELLEIALAQVTELYMQEIKKRNTEVN